MTTSDRDASERDRLARLGAGCRLLVFGFWSGQLPEISRLHFLTVAKALPPDSRYVLFTHAAAIPAPLRALIESRGIEIVAFDLMRLLREMGAEALARRTPLSRYWPLVRRLAGQRRCRRLLSRFGYIHSQGFTARSNFLLGGPPVTGAALANYVRVAISTVVPEHTLYTDIDFAFPRPLDWIFRHGSFVYRWDREPYANNALISAAPDSPIKRGALLECLVKAGCGNSWILFSQQNCRKVGLEILPCDRLEPLWAEARLHGRNFDRFWRRAEGSAGELALLKERYDAIHWHNRWDQVPEAGSPYDLWLNEFDGKPATP